MVNRLLTLSIKVNNVLIRRITIAIRGNEMIRTKAGRSIWTWLFGGGVGNAGSGG
jgi:hypothetical protein